MLIKLKADLKKLSNPEKAKFLSRFFKTAEGQYGYGDKFLGISVPDQRKVAAKYPDLSLGEIELLLKSEVHEERLTSLFILVNKFKKSDPLRQKEIFNFYLKNAKFVNNWDLVDSSADKIVGEFLLDKYRSILLKIAQSKNLWEKRIAALATFAFIGQGESEWSIKIAKILLHDPHDLIQKAVGWMLREVGKRVSEKLLIDFINQHYQTMPRTTLRYAIERLPEDLRLKYLKGEI